MDNQTFQRLREGSIRDNEVSENGMKLTGILMGIGAGLATLGILDTPIQEIGNYIHPLAKAGGAFMGAGGLTGFLTGCYIMAREIYRDDIMGYQDARYERELNPSL
jgi:hypothetical protein